MPSYGGKKLAGSSSHQQVTVHRQAAPIICRHVLDTLVFLSKHFASQFLLHESAHAAGKSETAVPPTSSAVESAVSTDFWEQLIRLDSGSSSTKVRKGRSLELRQLPQQAPPGGGELALLLHRSRAARGGSSRCIEYAPNASLVLCFASLVTPFPDASGQ